MKTIASIDSLFASARCAECEGYSLMSMQCNLTRLIFIDQLICSSSWQEDFHWLGQIDWIFNFCQLYVILVSSFVTKHWCNLRGIIDSSYLCGTASRQCSHRMIILADIELITCVATASAYDSPVINYLDKSTGPLYIESDLELLFQIKSWRVTTNQQTVSRTEPSIELTNFDQ